MKDVIIFNDFIGSVHLSADDECFYGKIEGINDLITFEGRSVKELKKSFIESVEDYKNLCKINNKEIHKSYKGNFNIRISPELHKKAVKQAILLGISLNQLVQKAIENELIRNK